MRMPLFFAFTAALLLAVTMPQSPTHAAPQPGVVALQPLMIIRFNEHDVDYANKLDEIISRAQSIKSNVVFDIIQYIPASQSSSRRARFKRNANELMAHFVSDGVEPDNIRFMLQAAPNIPTDEIYIFVR